MLRIKELVVLLWYLLFSDNRLLFIAISSRVDLLPIVACKLANLSAISEIYRVAYPQSVPKYTPCGMWQIFDNFRRMMY